MKRKIIIIKGVLLYLIIHSLFYLIQSMHNHSVYFVLYAEYPPELRALMVVYLLLLISCVIFSILALKLNDVGRRGIVIVEVVYIIQYFLGLMLYTNIAGVSFKKVILDISLALFFIIFFSHKKIREVFQTPKHTP